MVQIPENEMERSRLFSQISARALQLYENLTSIQNTLDTLLIITADPALLTPGERESLRQIRISVNGRRELIYKILHSQTPNHAESFTAEQ